MNKNKVIEQLSNLLSRGLRHKIGSIVNAQDIYASKYEKESQSLFKQAEEVALDIHWNSDDKKELQTRLKNKLVKELTEKDFLHQRKFEIMDEEIEDILKRLGLN